MARFCVTIGWGEVPHLTKQQCDDLLSQFPLHERDARSKGVPMLGSGKIYPVAEEDIVINPIELAPYWPRVFALDVGWNRTAALWGAWDKDSDIVYIYSEHYMGQQPPQVHAHSIKARGKFIPGVIDPASSGGSQKDGTKLLNIYRGLGLKLIPADNTVEAGIHEVYSRLVTGRLKVFRHCTNWTSEYRIYRRNKLGKIVKENDHLMDCTRYLVMSGLQIAQYVPSEENSEDYGEKKVVSFAQGKSRITGY